MAELRAETGWRSRQVSHSEPVGLALLLTEKGPENSGKDWEPTPRNA